MLKEMPSELLQSDENMSRASQENLVLGNIYKAVSLYKSLGRCKMISSAWC